MTANETLPNAPDLDGMIAYGCLSTVGRLGTDSTLVANTHEREALSGMAAQAYAGYREVADQVHAWGGDVHATMPRYRDLLKTLDVRVRPGDEWEREVMTLVMIGCLTDLFRLLYSSSRPDGAEYPIAFSGFGFEDWASARLKRAVKGKPDLAARLSLWGRRSFGDVLGLARLILDNELEALGIFNGDPVAFLKQLIDLHADRMKRAGLKA